MTVVDIYAKDFERSVKKLKKEGMGKRKIFNWALEKYPYVGEEVIEKRVIKVLKEMKKR